MRYPPNLLDDIRARLPVSQVVGRKVALKRAGRELKGLSPFKVEKSPSFFVNDQKGFYHCFASGEHGDVFTFLMKTEGLSFVEAVERLASEAGVTLPKPTERDAEFEDERTRLQAASEAACRFFEARLRAADGAEARRYIERRGLNRETVAKYRIGFAPAGRSALKEHLAGLGFTVEEQVRAGLLIGGDDIPVPYDRFRNRLMFPITDLRDRVIAFGGRALEADVPAKYLNSPETPLFHKGNLLFNAAKARSAAFDREQILVVEGYMDVVMLDQAGFANAVAPLGTALTESQIGILWRMAAEPTLCFDGDSAGRKAAHRAIDVALPLLEPGKSLAFAFMPDGLDPDDLVRQQGPEAMTALLARSRPLSDVLWEREWTAGDWSTPERRARLEQNLRQLLQKISDPAIRQHYHNDMRERLAAAWGSSARSTTQAPATADGRTTRDRRPWQPGRPSGGNRGFQKPGRPGQSGWQQPPPQATASLRASRIVAGNDASPPYREALLLKAILNHPWLLEEYAEDISSLELTSRAMAQLREALLSAASGDFPLDTARLRSQLTLLGSDKVVTLAERAITHRSDKFAEPNADRREVESGWSHTLALHNKQVGLIRAIEAAEQAWHSDASPDAWTRIVELRHMLDAIAGPDSSSDPSGASSAVI